jgi:hypothetical protein
MKDLPPAFRSIPHGGELIEALAEAFERHRGWIQAVGFVDDVELKLADDGAEVRQTHRGHFVLASLLGPLGGPYGATLARAVGERVEVLAGVLMRARSAGVSALCISAGDALPRAKSDDEAADPSQLGEPAKPQTLPKRPLTSAFAARVGVSESQADEEPEAELPERGDLVEHFAFGLCEVVSVTGDRLVVRDFRGGGRIREIASDRLAISGPSEHDGRRLFRLSRR